MITRSDIPILRGDLGLFAMLFLLFLFYCLPTPGGTMYTYHTCLYYSFRWGGGLLPGSKVQVTKIISPYERDIKRRNGGVL